LTRVNDTIRALGLFVSFLLIPIGLGTIVIAGLYVVDPVGGPITPSGLTIAGIIALCAGVVLFLRVRKKG